MYGDLRQSFSASVHWQLQIKGDFSNQKLNYYVYALATVDFKLWKPVIARAREGGDLTHVWV